MRSLPHLHPPRHPAGHPRGRCDAGFTIIEMMVVLSILAIAMSAAPAIMAGLAGARLRAA
ncbi:MAG: Tfp pilus assembly protein FimT/FimU, partial [Thiohalocapsa sp.]